MNRPIYRFENFDLNPDDRSLRKSGVLVPLPPKAMDALLCLVSKPGRLVSKREFIDGLWPETFVSETNLTNVIVALRKVIGRNAIQTVAKHGYRFATAVQGHRLHDAGGIEQQLTRARELAAYRSRESIESARNLVLTCIAKDPSHAAAWAWLGRCCVLLSKLSESSESASELASAAFDRAFTLDPHLAIAHQFYTSFQIDRGHTRSAMTRLLHRLHDHPVEAETLSGLVQVLRCCGLLDESMRVSKRAAQIDPAILTSVPHTYFLQCDYGAAIDAYGGRSGYYMDVAAWAALGATNRAKKLLRERLATLPSSGPMVTLMTSLKLILEGRKSEAAEAMRDLSQVTDPEGLFYFARHFALIDMPDETIQLIDRAAVKGFIIAPETLTRDPALAALRNHNRFPTLLRSSEKHVLEARAEWNWFPSTVASFSPTSQA